MNVVISQSMLFPWVGLLEQIRLADVFVHYDDVQFSKGSFTNRVQVKTQNGLSWMTVPLDGHNLGQAINEVRVQPHEKWMAAHLDLLAKSFDSAPYLDDAMAIVKDVYSIGYGNIALLARQSLMTLAEYFNLLDSTQFIDVSTLDVKGSSSDRVLAIVKAVGGTRYITGHGARNYLNHDIFESNRIQVEYMSYQCIPYPQNHGRFTPYVTALDLVAHRGQAGGSNICSKSIYWKDFLYEPN